MMLRELSELRAAEFLQTLDEGKRKPGLQRIERLVQAMGSPMDRYRAVHLAGTNGKGSTAAMIESVLRASGLRTGLYTSPHLVSLRERIRIDGKPISVHDMARWIDTVRHLSDEEDDAPSFFEVVTACAFGFFSERGIDIGVFETGLGGRLDATNVLKPVICVLTSISLDHQTWLGGGLVEIASEKAGILKRGVPVVSCWKDPEVLEILAAKCNDLGIPLILEGRDYSIESIRRWNARRPGSVRFVGRNYCWSDVPLVLAGTHQVENAGMALAVVERLKSDGCDISDDAVYDGMAEVSWPGRMEMLDGMPPVLLDGAHNPAAAEALVESLKAMERPMPDGRFSLLFAVSRDKDVESMLSALSAVFPKVVLTTFPGGRAYPPETIEPMSRSFFQEVEVERDLPVALAKAKAGAGSNGLVVAAGSLFLVGALKAMIDGTSDDPFIFS